MKILILNWKDIKHPQVGGAEIIVYELAKRLVSNNHDVTWFTRYFEGAKKEERVDGIKVVRRGNLVTQYLHAPIYYWKLRKKPDIVIDMSNTIYWQTPLWAFKSKKIAYLNQLGMQVFDYEFNLPMAKIGKIIERLQYIPYVGMSFVCYSKSTKEDLVKMGVNPKKINIFPLGIDHSRYRPGKAKSKDPLFICVSRLVRMKRTDLAIEAMSTVVTKYPKAKLVIMGSGYERANLENLRNSLNLQENVIFQDEHTWFFEKSNKDVKVSYMQGAWALIFPSVKEGWGMTVTECAACGTSSIVTDVTGLRDSVVKDKTGLIVSKNPDASELADAMIKIIDGKELREKLSKNALKNANKYTWENSYKKFAKIITKL